MNILARFSCVFLLVSFQIGSMISAASAKPLQADQAQSGASPAQTLKPPLAFGLEDGTPVKLRLQRTVSSADAQLNDTVDFDVLEEIKVKDVVVIPKGSVALGTVTEAQPKRRMARGGKLNVNIDSVRLADGEKAALRAMKQTSGGGHVGAMTGAIVATSIVFFPAAPFFLFMHGKDITIPKGTEITAYINGDTSLDAAKFGGVAGNQVAPAGTASPSSTQPVTHSVVANPTPESSTVILNSVPDGADIAVDGKYAGSTPSTLKLPPGDHAISVDKAGFKTWQRTISLNAGSNITISTTLEKTP